jgi:WD40 repeat protein
VGTANGRIVVRTSNGIERVLSSGGPRIVAIRASGPRLAAADASGRVRVWSRDALVPTGSFQAHGVGPSALEVDDDRIASGGADGSLRVWTWSGEALGRWEARGGITALVLRRGSIAYGDAVGELGDLALRST